MKILVLGSDGQLGRCLIDQLAGTYFEVTYASRKHLDIAKQDDARAKILHIRPQVVINAAAYTAVDSAEKNPGLAEEVNHLAVKNIADVCSTLDIWLIHISTDYVFAGDAKIPYREVDQVGPNSVYGETKLRGELAVRMSGCRHTIIRTAWVFSEYGNNFLKTMLRLGAERETVRVVNDQIGCPTYCQDIAKAVLKILTKNDLRRSGVYHFSGDSPCTWYDFAVLIFQEASKRNFKTPESIFPVRSGDFSTLAKRPAFSVLDNTRISMDYDVKSSNWVRGVAEVLDKLSVHAQKL